MLLLLIQRLMRFNHASTPGFLQSIRLLKSPYFQITTYTLMILSRQPQTTKTFITWQHDKNRYDELNLPLDRFPLKFGQSITSHCSQGATIERVHFISEDNYMVKTKGALLVPLSRATKLSNISVHRPLSKPTLLQHLIKFNYCLCPKKVV